jgi:DNA-binding NarL/FixJ family response regulator
LAKQGVALMTIKALIADDHGLYRTGLALLLKDRLGVADVIEVGGFDQALDRLADTAGISLALFDLSMPGMGGPDSLRVIKETYPDVRVAVVSGLEERDYVLKAISIGLNGYVPKSLSEDDIAAALQQIVAGHIYIPKFMTLPASSVPGNRSDNDFAGLASATPRLDELTPRQRDVLACILRGRSNKEVARDLSIAEGTVKIHLAALFTIFSARNRTELATRAQALSR